MTSDRLIQLSAITMDKHSVDFQKAEKTIVLDDPDIQIKVGEPSLLLVSCWENNRLRVWFWFILLVLP